MKGNAVRLLCRCQNETAVRKLATKPTRSPNNRRPSTKRHIIPAMPINADDSRAAKNASGPATHMTTAGNANVRFGMENQPTLEKTFGTLQKFRLVLTR